ncbi:MAG TPA: right-handed parallel beta-helix repeat-containing protein [Solirubrobacteraceae bacterium]
MAVGLGLLAWAPQAIASPAYVQAASGSTSGSSLGVSYTANVQAGDLLVGQFRTNGTTSVSDSVNGSWTEAAQTTKEGVTHSIWYRQNAAAGKTTVTVSGGTSGSLRTVLAEYSGVATTGALDQTACNQGTSTSVTTGATASVGTGDLLFVGVGAFEHPLTVTAGSGDGVKATLRTQFSGTNGTSAEEDVSSTESGAQNASFTLNESTPSGWAACAAAFHPQSEETVAPTCTKYANAATGSDSNTGTKESPYKTLKKLVTSLSAGQVGCLQAGQTFATESDASGNGELTLSTTKGEPGKPVTITSTSSTEPATIAHPVTLENGANNYTFTHLIFKWKDPAPHACWNAEGKVVAGKVIHEPLNGTCETGTANSESHVQIAIAGINDDFTYDDINAEHSDICINVVRYPTEPAENTHIENDRIHGCGPPVLKTTEGGFAHVNEEPGWHDHGIYDDEGVNGVFKNNYIYECSRNGFLFYPAGKGSVAEHNVIDANGNGVTFGSNTHESVKWNIITNSTSPRKYDSFGITSFVAGEGNLAEHNDTFGNEGYSGEGPNIEIEPEEVKNVSLVENIEENPKYAKASEHKYESYLNTYGYGPTSPPTKY